MNHLLKYRFWFTYAEAFLTSLVVGFAENYFAAFALENKLSALDSGYLVSFPLLIAALGQYFLQSYLQKSTSIGSFVKQALNFQILSLLGLLIISLLRFAENVQIKQILFSNSLSSQQVLFYILFFLYVLYWLGHFCIQPAWNKWISDIIPLDEGQYYFSSRTRLTQIGILLGLLFGGYFLHQNRVVDVFYLYTILFFVCLVLKIIIVYLFSQHPQAVEVLHIKKDHFKKLLTEHRHFFLRYAFFNMTLFISAPYVAGYLMTARGLNYEEFMWVMAGLFIGKMVGAHFLNKINLKADPFTLMIIGILIAGPLPAFWPFCTSIFTMIALHMISGVGWSIWEVGLSLNFFKKFSGETKLEIVSLYNYFGIGTQVLGTLFGALIFKTVLKENFDQLFILAGVVRLIAVLVLAQARFGSHHLQTTVLTSQK